MINASPWKTVTIAPFIELINGFAFPSDRFTEEEGMPLIRIRDLDRQETEINFYGRYDNRYLVKRGDLLIGMDGDFLTVKWKGSNALLNQRVCKLVTKDAKQLAHDFLFYRIIDEIVRINRITSATTVKHLSSRDVLGIKIDLPPKPEQIKIAEILSTVDRAIEQTEALIAKQQRIKTGLMQDLLTRGIDEHGNLRSEQTHQFKNSPLGRIPMEWEVTRLNRCVRSDSPICYGILMPGTGYENGVPVIKVKDIIGGCIIQDGLLLTDPKIDSQYKRSRLRTGDLLITIRGTTGRLARVPPELDQANITQDTARVRLKKEYSWQYFYFLLQSKAIQDQIELHTLGQAVKGINIGEVKKLLFGLPSNDEQHEIAERLAALEEGLGSTDRKLKKLRSLKNALMQDLLTGKKRVTPLLADAMVTN